MITRTLTGHIVTPSDAAVAINVVDAPGSGGANHQYEIVFNPEGDTGFVYNIGFQNGPIGEDGNGVNGLTQEILLEIVADRLRSFQAGPFACKANACALTHVEEALHWLQQRTLERIRRGVEGTNKA